MTDATPSPTPPKGWHSLTQNTKIAIGVLGAIIVLAIVVGASGGNSNNTSTTPTTPTTVDFATQFSSWKTSFLPIFSQFQADYTTTVADLTNADTVAATNDFATLAQDASTMESASGSPDLATTSAISQLCSDIQALSSEGIQSITDISNGGSLTAGFGTYAQNVGMDITALTTALQNANSR